MYYDKVKISNVFLNSVQKYKQINKTNKNINFRNYNTIYV